MPLDLRRLFGITPQPDGQAGALEAEALVETPVEAPRPSQHRPPPRPDSVVQAALAQKILHGWMQNRHQTRYPLVLNLRNTTADEAALLLAVVRGALAAVDPGPAAFQRAQDWIATIGGELQPGADPMLASLGPAPIEQLHTARLAPQAYAACAGSLGRRTATARRYLDFLAARLGLPDDVARSLNRRFAA